MTHCLKISSKWHSTSVAFTSAHVAAMLVKMLGNQEVM